MQRVPEVGKSAHHAWSPFAFSNKFVLILFAEATELQVDPEFTVTFVPTQLADAGLAEVIDDDAEPVIVALQRVMIRRDHPIHLSGPDSYMPYKVCRCGSCGSDFKASFLAG